MMRLPEGAVGNDLLSGRAAAAAKSARWSAWIERETYLTPTGSPPPPHLPLPPRPLLLPLHHPACTHLRLANSELGTSLELMFFSTPLILICFQSPPPPLPYSPSPLFCVLLLSVFPLSPLCITLSSPLRSQGSKHQMERLGNRRHVGKC